MTDKEKAERLISALVGIATLPDSPYPQDRLNKVRILAKIALRQVGVQPEGGGFHSRPGGPLHYNDLPEDLSKPDVSKA